MDVRQTLTLALASTPTLAVAVALAPTLNLAPTLTLAVAVALTLALTLTRCGHSGFDQCSEDVTGAAYLAGDLLSKVLVISTYNDQLLLLTTTNYCYKMVATHYSSTSLLTTH